MVKDVKTELVQGPAAARAKHDAGVPLVSETLGLKANTPGCRITVGTTGTNPSSEHSTSSHLRTVLGSVPDRWARVGTQVKPPPPPPHAPATVYSSVAPGGKAPEGSTGN